MFKVIKSELIKYFSGLMIYISTAITILLSLLDFIATKLIVTLSPEAVPELVERYANMTSQTYIINSLMSLFSGGAIFIVATIVVATIISEDYGKGTMKYSLLATSRGNLILGKIVTTGVINAIFVGASFVAAVIIGSFTFNWDSAGFTMIEIMVVYFLAWMTMFGFSSIVMFMINKISKISGAIGVGVGVYMVTSIVGALVPESIKPLILTANFGKVMDMTISSWSEVVYTNLGYIIVFSSLVFISFRKKEMLY